VRLRLCFGVSASSSLRIEDQGVHVTALTPGFIDTPVIPKLLEDPGALPMKPMYAEDA